MTKDLKRNQFICFNCSKGIVNAGKRCTYCKAKAFVSPNLTKKPIINDELNDAAKEIINRYHIAIKNLSTR